jgi:hypothetical protein
LSGIQENSETKKNLLDFFFIEALLKIPEFKVPQKMIAFLKNHSVLEDVYIHHKLKYSKKN